MRTIAWSQNLSAQSGVVRIHYKLSDRRRGLGGARELGLMKPSTYLLNTSRGSIVEENALLDALQTRRIAGATLDVFDREPLPAAHPYRFLPKVLATPDVGYVTEEPTVGRMRRLWRTSELGSMESRSVL